MPRHRGVGMNRAIKRKVSWLEPAQEEVINAEEPEDQTRATSQEPGPSSSPLPRSEPAESEVSELSWLLSFVEELHVKLLQAQRHLEVIERRWEKKKKTYHEGSKNSCWAALSVTQRCEARMFEADKELGEARAWMVHWNRGWRLAQSSYTVTKRCLRNPGNEVDTQLLCKVVARFAAWDADVVPHWKSMWPGLRQNIWDWNARQFGLGITWGLMHVDSLHAPEDPDDPWGKRRMAAAHAEFKERQKDHQLRMTFDQLVHSGRSPFRPGQRPPRGDARYEAAYQEWRAKRDATDID